MTRLQSRLRRRASERGFTLIELLVVIIILGVLAAVVVFAVTGVGDKGKSNAVTIDERTLRTAQEAYCAKSGRYADGATLVAEGFLSDAPQYHQVFAQQGGGNCNGWKYTILRTAQAGAYPEGTWAATNPPPAMFPIFSERLADGRVLVGGTGPNTGDDGKAVAAIWDPGSDAWTSVDEMDPVSDLDPVYYQRIATDAAMLLTDDPATPANECASGTVNNCGKVLVDVQHLFDPTKLPGDQWDTLVTPTTPCYLCHPGFVAILSMVQIKGSSTTCGAICGRILMVGDTVGGAEPTPAALLYDPKDNSYQNVPYDNGVTAQYGAYLVQVPDGRVFVCCGSDEPGSSFFDPLTLSWSNGPVPPAFYYRNPGYAYDNSGSRLPTPILPNGDLLFGTDFSAQPGTAGIYTPQANGPGTFDQVTGCGLVDRCQILATLTDGRVLGRDLGSGIAYIFNPVTRAWTPTGPVPSPVTIGASVLLEPSRPCGTHCGKVFTVGEGDAALFAP